MSLSDLYSSTGWFETGQFIKCSQQPTLFSPINAPIFSNVTSSNVQAGFLSSNLQCFRVSATSWNKTLNSEDLQLPVGIPIDSHRTTGSHQPVAGTSTIEGAKVSTDKHQPTEHSSCWHTYGLANLVYRIAGNFRDIRNPWPKRENKNKKLKFCPVKELPHLALRYKTY